MANMLSVRRSRRALVATVAIGALELLACHSKPSDDSAAASRSGGATASPASDATMPALPDATPPQTVRLSLLTGDNAPMRRFVPGLSLFLLYADGGSSPVPIGPVITADDGQEMTASPVTPGHYRVSFLVAACAHGAKPGECKPINPKPDAAEFDVPPSGDVELTVR